MHIDNIVNWLKEIQKGYRTTICFTIHDDGSGCVEHEPYNEPESIVDWETTNELIAKVKAYESKRL